MRYLYFFVFILFTSCQTIDVVSFEVLNPAKIAIPASLNSVVIINNSLLEGENKITDKKKKDRFILDTLTSQQSVQKLDVLLKESPRLNKSVCLTDIYYRTHANYKKTIAWSDVAYLCNENECDALLALDLFTVLDTNLPNYYYDEYDGTRFENSLALIATSLFRIYDNKQKKIIDNAVVRDTFMLTGNTRKDQLYGILKRGEAREYIADKVSWNLATQMSDRIAPYWEEVDRNYFNNGHPDMKQGATFALSDNWEQAAETWKKQVNTDNKKLAGAACHNLAVACEVLGKVDLAIYWVSEALNRYENQISKQYYFVLLKRQSKVDILNQQFHQ